MVNNRPIKFIIDSGSPVTLLSNSQFNNITPLHLLKTEYRDVKDNRIQFERKTTAKVEIDGKQKELEILVTIKRTNPLLGLDWMKKPGITLGTSKTVPQIQQIKEDPDITTLKTKFKILSTLKPQGKWIGSKNTAERRRETDTTERKTNTDSLTTIGKKRTKKSKTGPH